MPSAGSAFTQLLLSVTLCHAVHVVGERGLDVLPQRHCDDHMLAQRIAPDYSSWLLLTSLNGRLQPGELRRVPGRAELHRLVHARHCCGAGTAVRVGRGRLLHIAARCVGVRRERWSHFGTVRTIHNIQWYGLCSFGFY